MDGHTMLRYPIYYFDGYGNESWDISSSLFEMVDIELESSDDDDDDALSQYEIVQIDEYLVDRNGNRSDEKLTANKGTTNEKLIKKPTEVEGYSRSDVEQTTNNNNNKRIIYKHVIKPSTRHEGNDNRNDGQLTTIEGITCKKVIKQSTMVEGNDDKSDEPTTKKRITYKKIIILPNRPEIVENLPQVDPLSVSPNTNRAEHNDVIIAKWKPHLQCVYCQALCVNFALLESHISCTHPNKTTYTVCSCCNIKFYDTYSFADHIKTCHSDDTVSEPQPTEIPAEVVPEEKDEFIQHYMPQMVCFLCQKNCANFSMLMDHFRNDHPGHLCYIKCCDRQLQLPHSIVEHIRVHIDPHTFKCDLCDKFNFSKYVLDQHLHKLHRVSLWPASQEYDYAKVSEKNKSIARIRFEDLDNFIAQWRPALTCMLCSLRFLKFTSLSRHYRDNHPNDECYVMCCNIKFKRRNDLEEHIHIHRNPKGFKCIECNEHFVKRSNLYSHIIAHHPFPKGIGKCGSKKFLKNHNTNHGTSNLVADRKPTKLDALIAYCKLKVECGECGRKFYTSTLLKEHFLTDHAEKQLYFYCCGKKIKFITGFSYHLNRIHVTNTTEQKILQFSLVTCSDYNEYIAQWKPTLICEKCGSSFVTYSGLEDHFIHKHSNVECYITCCGKKLTCRHTIAEHVEYHFSQRSETLQKIPT